ncbi:MAG TPA: phytoene desaturase family protein [Longimicrobiaceae bacterium]|nr:phytoene desaturase family protein [Longimicrobiaceae bacterium]
MADVLVIGAGMGGLSAAIALAASGVDVEVLEAGEWPGGKLGIRVIDGVEVDTGPSVLTLPETLDRILRLAGSSLAEEIELLEPEPSFRYLYPDGVVLDVHPSLDRTVESVERTLGYQAAGELAAFLAYSRRIWEAAAPHFVFGQAPSVGSLLTTGVPALASLPRIDPLRRMWEVIRRRIRTPHLRMLLARYATYNGSDPRRAPATLNCIAHVELALGGFGVRGGMYEIVRVLVRAAERLGVRIHYGARVTRIRLEGNQVERVETEDGRAWHAEAVVANADAAQVLGELLPAAARRGGDVEPSMSGWVAVLRARRRTGPEQRIAHTVLFPRDYLREFADIFDHQRPPREPTVYLCAQEIAHGRGGWPDYEPLFVMTNAPVERDRAKNAPAEPAGGSTAESWEILRERVLGRLDAAGLREEGDEILFERTPADLAVEFPGSRGSIYGAASNSPLAAFRRPPNRVPWVRGLYLASGSAHPGGGVPLCLLSGQAAARALLADHGVPLRNRVAS